MESFLTEPLFLRNKIQNYSWGTRNEEAYIPQLLNLEPQKDVPYAELWMGIHPNAPSEVMLGESAQNLDEIIRQFPEKILGLSNARKYHNKLPFLFKVLSAGEALSIQAHPNKQQALFLNRQDPEHYPDTNHKPEIAIALDNLSALVGFKTYAELQSIFSRYPEIKEFSDSEIITNFCQSRFTDELRREQVWKSVFSSLMRDAVSDPQRLETALQRLDARFSKSASELNEHELLFRQLRPKYGTDVGLLTIFMLNILHLHSGEAVFLNAGVPHAYLRGNIIECMANSDNVVRAGLTPKFQDFDTLTDILNYSHQPFHVLGSRASSAETEYKTPAEEFMVKRWIIKEGETRLIDLKDAVQIIILIKGGGEIGTSAGKWSFRAGESAVLPACLIDYSITAHENCEVFAATIP